MTRIVLLCVLLALAIGAPNSADAACFAEYKAKKEGKPLRLHYGVIELPNAACRDKARAAAVISDRIGAGGWKLLNLMSIFGSDKLEEKKASAGEYFLRF